MNDTMRSSMSGASAADRARSAANTATKEAEHTATGIVDAAKEKVHDLASGASDLVGKAKDAAQEWGSHAACQVKDTAEEVASMAMDKAGDLGKELTQFIRRNPLPSLLVGVGIGFLAAQVFHGGRR